ncbi:hypothetical protein GCM10010964_06760 [Caldovatus sediminis]|uniref:Uncharacterized protein n=1 Tax=Caldovatus sediminis TaxID=2041189 RepID=A0A8J2Z8D9_9PROT|nr:hypothetical protein [Caldovatus sediminis]GGG21206.1 hypothetical protein GCM10010964_06760 [Caldovatus sediminis]
MRGRLVRFLKARLARRIPLGGTVFTALAETAAAAPGEGHTFCADSNAKAAELLVHPALWNEDPEFAAGLLDFVLAMGGGPGGSDAPAAAPLLRRVVVPPPGPAGAPPPGAGAAPILVLSENPRDFAVRTPMHEYAGDLARGLVVQSVRSAGPGGAAIRHTGNLFELTHRGRRYCLDVEDAIAEYGIERTAAGGVRLHHAGPVVARAGRFGNALRFGTLRYEYEIAPDRPALLRLTVRFTPAPGMAAEISRLRVTTACDDLSLDGSQAFEAVHVDAPEPARSPSRRHADLPPGTSTVAEGAAGLVCLAQEGRPPGFAHGLYIRPLDPERMLSVKAAVQRRGRLHWVLTRYAAETLEEQESLTAREDRLLVGGGLHADPAARAALIALAGSAPPGTDLSLCLDQGAVLNAVATHLLLAAGGHYRRPPPPERQARLRAWCEGRIEAYFAALAPERPGATARVYSRELAFVALALDCLWRLTGERRHRARLGQAVDLLLGLLRDAEEDPALPPAEAAFRDAWSTVAYLDCHAAAVLALARVALHRDDPRLGPALRRALAAIRLATGTAREGARRVVFDSVAVRSREPEGGWAEDIGVWSYKLALTLRALRAVQAAAAAGAIALEGTETARLGFLATLCLDLLRDRIRLEGDALEVRPGPLTEATSAETQVWTVLALMPTDAPIARTAPGLAAAGHAAPGEATGKAAMDAAA